MTERGSWYRAGYGPDFTFAEHAAGEDPWKIVCDHYQGRLCSGPSQRLRLSTVDRGARRKALSKIFEILGATAFRQRLIAVRVIVDAISEYHRRRLHLQNKAKRLAWYRRVSAHAEALANLAQEYPEEFAFLIMEYPKAAEDAYGIIDDLRRWGTNAGHYGGFRPRPPGTRWLPEAAQCMHDNIAVMKLEAIARENAELYAPEPMRTGRGPKTRDGRPVQLIDDLEQLYLLATGRYPSRCTTSTKSGERHDPSVEFLHAVWRLAGVNRARPTIQDDIREWRDQNRGMMEMEDS
jgi:hypothetical protein